MILIKKITAQETYPLRQSVLRPGKPASAVAFEGDDDEGTFHLGAIVETKITGIATFVSENHPAFKVMHQCRLRGMATDPAFRHQQVGRKLIDCGEDMLRNLNVELLWFNARESAFGFYQKLGFSTYGSLFEIEGVGPHKVMYKYLYTT